MSTAYVSGGRGVVSSGAQPDDTTDAIRATGTMVMTHRMGAARQKLQLPVLPARTELTLLFNDVCAPMSV
ncbi:hypothetical protein Ari01nite_15490 [Paractinoplanes rishiriensis]|uniref:Uncharacterized protein n=1 Tax=Paractinoplanes rishiriensis TaxID=1050105 RepID=A0A919JVL9_9ACTN|nr:hypothetical protein Ari01nite_15490 [Actinoplanes rishiriensis]